MTWRPAPGEQRSSVGDSSNLRKHTSRNPLQRWLIRRFHAAIERQLADLVADRPAPARVIDVGCGEGFTVAYLAQSDLDLALHGVDADPDALAIGTLRLGEIPFSQGEIVDLPFPDGSFDVVLCLEVLEHLPDPARALSELLRISSQALILSVPDQPLFAGANLLRGRNLATLGDDPDHRHRWTAGQFARWVGRAGTVRRVIRTFPWVIVVVERTGAAPAAPARAGRSAPASGA